jgi:hypothetical protein
MNFYGLGNNFFRKGSNIQSILITGTLMEQVHLFKAARCPISTIPMPNCLLPVLSLRSRILHDPHQAAASFFGSPTRLPGYPSGYDYQKPVALALIFQ